MRRALSRLLAGSAAALLAAAAVASPAAPAQAADPTLGVHFPDLAVATDDAGGKINALMAWIDLPDADAGSQIGKFRISVDAAGVSDLATVATFDDLEFAEQSCERAGTVITCTLGGPFPLTAGPNLILLLAVHVTAKPGAATGATGKLAFTVQADDGPAVSYKSTVEIGDGVDLAAVDTAALTVAPGAVGATDLRVANNGKRPVTGVVLALLGWAEGLVEGEGFSNCTYGLLTVCTFDDVLAPGETYELSTPMRLRMPADAAAGSSAVALGGWYTPSDFREILSVLPGDPDEVPLGTPGKGGRVHLSKRAPAASASSSRSAAAAQVDTKPDNNVLISEVVVAGSRKPDLAAVGATVTGSAGDRVHTRIGFRNDGPGTLYHASFDNTEPATHITVPARLRAVTVDSRCVPAADFDFDGDDFDGEAETVGAAEYLCLTLDDRTKAKSSVLFAFTFEVLDDASEAAGQVRINEEFFTGGEPLDRDASNDSAKIVVSASGSGGGLPVTGANAGLAGAAGAALLLAGGLGLLLARRRRVRFTP